MYSLVVPFFGCLKMRKPWGSAAAVGEWPAARWAAFMSTRVVTSSLGAIEMLNGCIPQLVTA